VDHGRGWGSHPTSLARTISSRERKREREYSSAAVWSARVVGSPKRLWSLGGKKRTRRLGDMETEEMKEKKKKK